IPRYARNFADVARGLRNVTLEQETEVEAGMSPCGLALSEPRTPTMLRHGERRTAIDAFPVGTDPRLISQLLDTESSQALQRSIREEFGDQRLIVAVGRTDYTKGVRETLLSFERLLERRPELHRKLKLIVVSVRAASGMRIYRDTQRDIEALVGRINGRFSSLGWTPVLLFSNAVPFDRVVAYYHMADICMTTPLRDGLNLVAKEFVAAKRGQPGVLVLSEFAGCAVELPQAVLTNPYSQRAMDAALDQALDMSADEARARMATMLTNISRYDVTHWVQHTFERFNDIMPGDFTNHFAPHAAT
ncbi:MAG: trehalose-6-phosphate synthase, partial [Gammaproteobacteria bacterium]